MHMSTAVSPRHSQSLLLSLLPTLLLLGAATSACAEKVQLRPRFGWTVFTDDKPDLTTMRGPHAGLDVRVFLGEHLYVGGGASYFHRKRYLGYLETQERDFVNPPILDWKAWSLQGFVGGKWRLGKDFQYYAQGGIGASMLRDEVQIEGPNAEVFEYIEKLSHSVVELNAATGFEYRFAGSFGVFVELGGSLSEEFTVPYLGELSYTRGQASFGVSVGW